MATNNSVKIIMHVDMDMFFAAVEIRDDPSLKDKPIAVGGPSPKRGVVACASYNARKFGVHAGMPNIQAVQLCPKLIFITPNFDKYMEASDELRKVLFNFSPYVEMFSIDEAFLDVTGCTRLWGTPRQMVSRIKSLVKSRIGLNCSVGIAPTKYLAKYAAGVNKPSGFFIISPEKLKDILPQIPVKKISGVGPQFQKVLKRLGVVKLGDVLKFPEDYWRSRLGKVGYWLYNVAMGKELEPVSSVTNVKSMGKEFTLVNDTDNYEEVKKHLLYISENLGWRLRKSHFEARTIVLKIRDSSFFTTTIQNTLSEPTYFHKDIYHTALTLLNRVNLKVKKVRLIGISVSNLTPVDHGNQLSLFNYQNTEKQIKLAEATDKLWEKYGKFSVKPAILLEE